MTRPHSIQGTRLQRTLLVWVSQNVFSNVSQKYIGLHVEH